MRRNKLNALDWTAYTLVVVGGINWGLVGAFDYNLVAELFGRDAFLSNLVYFLVGLAAIYLLFTAIKVVNRTSHPTTT